MAKKKSEELTILSGLSRAGKSGLFRELGRHGGTKRMASLSAEQKTALGKKAARAKKMKAKKMKAGK